MINRANNLGLVVAPHELLIPLIKREGKNFPEYWISLSYGGLSLNIYPAGITIMV